MTNDQNYLHLKWSKSFSGPLEAYSTSLLLDLLQTIFVALLNGTVGCLHSCMCRSCVLKLGLDLSIDNVAFQHLRRISPYLCLNTHKSLKAMGLPWKSTNYSSNHHSSQHKDQCIGHCIYDDIFTTMTWLTPEVSINRYLNEIVFLKWWA